MNYYLLIVEDQVPMLARAWLSHVLHMSPHPPEHVQAAVLQHWFGERTRYNAATCEAFDDDKQVVAKVRKVTSIGESAYNFFLPHIAEI